jgi:phosphoribosylanthranilate isomerase
MSIKIQVYCRRPTYAETNALIGMGVTHVGWGVSPSEQHAVEMSRGLAARARSAGVATTILVHEPCTNTMERIAKEIGPDFVLVPAEYIGRGIDESELPALARRLAPYAALMMSVPVRAHGSRSRIDSLERARRYEDFSACLILDTLLEAEDGAHCGCTGRTNDWDICARIVAEVRCRVMLAGGLNPRNVAEAIRRVRPWAVDACTSLERPDHSKDLEVCESFLRAARSASAELIERGAAHHG